MNLSLPLFHFETWASFLFGFLALCAVVATYVRTKIFAFLVLTISGLLFKVQLFIHYYFWLGRLQPTVSLQLTMTGIFLVASALSLAGMTMLCHRAWMQSI